MHMKYETTLIIIKRNNVWFGGGPVIYLSEVQTLAAQTFRMRKTDNIE